MKQDFERIHGKLDKFDERLDNIDTHLAVYNEQLKVHIKRTEMLEEDVAPIKDHVNQVKGAIKLITIGCAIAGAVIAIMSYLG